VSAQDVAEELVWKRHTAPQELQVLVSPLMAAEHLGQVESWAMAEDWKLIANVKEALVRVVCEL